jgi:hypothetical protein
MRINDPKKTPFGKQLKEHGVILEWVAKSRIEIDAARLVVLNAAIKVDQLGAKGALTEIAEAKVLVPQMALTVIDRAVQSFGGAGVCQDTPLANMWANIRTLRLADGPDEVHLQQMGKNENRRGAQVTENIQKQVEITNQLFAKYGVRNEMIPVKQQQIVTQGRSGAKRSEGKMLPLLWRPTMSISRKLSPNILSNHHHPAPLLHHASLSYRHHRIHKIKPSQTCLPTFSLIETSTPLSRMWMRMPNLRMGRLM